MDFLEKKPQLKEILNNPYLWQEFVRKELLDKVSDDRTVDWLIDPVGNTGKSSFPRAYLSEVPTDGILIKIDNLDRMELTFIKKIEIYIKEGEGGTSGFTRERMFPGKRSASPPSV